MQRWELDFQHFNPLPRKEGDTKIDLSRENLCDFNPLPRKEGDTKIDLSRENLCDFNPLPRKEGDAAAATATPEDLQFQSTPS